MLVLQLLLMSLLLLMIPAVIGSLFVKIYSEKNGLIFGWISGQIVLWAGFLVICVPAILSRQSFTLVCNLFHLFTIGWVCIALVVWVRRFAPGRKKNSQNSLKELRKHLDRSEMFLWGVFWVLLLMQFIMAVILAYEEGDDAFYLAIATITEEADTMYIKLPYTGGTTGLDARHGLAPFPVWIAYLGRTVGMHPLIIAQVVLAVTIPAMAYGIYYLIAKHICRENKKNVPFFMVLVELLVIFGGYSAYSVENFLLVRASQGKAVLANIALPFLLYLLMLLVDDLQEEQKSSKVLWMLMAGTAASGCLCSTQGTILVCLLLGVAGICITWAYKNLKVLISLMFVCVLPVGMALMYWMIQ